MPITASSVIRRATDILMDNTSVRWPAAELVRWLNDAQRDIVLVRPDALKVNGTMSLQLGTRQSLRHALANAAGNGPLVPTATKLIEIPRCMTGTQGAITHLERHILDRQMPAWHTFPGSLNILHYLFDPREPESFLVYPPAAAGAKVELMYSGTPVDIAEPADGSTFAAVAGNLSLPEQYASALLDLVLYRAYSKDSEFAGNEGRAAAHRASAIALIGAELAGTLAVKPQAKPGQNA